MEVVQIRAFVAPSCTGLFGVPTRACLPKHQPPCNSLLPSSRYSSFHYSPPGLGIPTEKWYLLTCTLLATHVLLLQNTPKLPVKDYSFYTTASSTSYSSNITTSHYPSSALPSHRRFPRPPASARTADRTGSPYSSVGQHGHDSRRFSSEVHTCRQRHFVSLFLTLSVGVERFNEHPSLPTWNGAYWGICGFNSPHRQTLAP